MTRPLYLHSGHLLDPSEGIDRVSNLLVDEGRVVAIDVSDPPEGAERVDATGRMICPGLIDIGVQLREPGNEEDETIFSGLRAAIAGGFTTIACTPDTDPPIDTPAGVEFVLHQARRAGLGNVCVLACISKHREGQQLAEMGTLAEAGAVGFTDASAPVTSAELMRRALQYSQMFDLPILNQPESQDLARDGIMHEGLISTILGLPGIPAEAEDVLASRDIRLVQATGGRLHLLHISTSGAVGLVARAKQIGAHVTAGIALPNLLLTDESLRSFSSLNKLNPPLRSEEHRQRCLEGIRSGELDLLGTAHAPRAAEKKMNELDVAPFGAVGLETAWGLIGAHLVQPGHLTWLDAVKLCSTNPARLLNLRQKGTLRAGADADIVLFHPQKQGTVNPRTFYSSSWNTPFADWPTRGAIEQVWVAGQLKFASHCGPLAELATR